MKADQGEEHWPDVELHSVRDADVADRTTWTCGTNRLHHRFLGANALEHRIRADAFGQVLNARNALIAALGYDVRRAELLRELLALLMPTHGDDPFRSHLLC